MRFFFMIVRFMALNYSPSIYILPKSQKCIIISGKFMDNFWKFVSKRGENMNCRVIDHELYANKAIGKKWVIYLAQIT